MKSNLFFPITQASKNTSTGAWSTQLETPLKSPVVPKTLSLGAPDRFQTQTPTVTDLEKPSMDISSHPIQTKSLLGKLFSHTALVIKIRKLVTHSCSFVFIIKGQAFHVSHSFSLLRNTLLEKQRNIIEIKKPTPLGTFWLPQTKGTLLGLPKLELEWKRQGLNNQETQIPLTQ